METIRIEADLDADFDALFERLYPPLYRYLHRLTGDADVADDIAQESFVRLYRERLPADEARPWIFRVATNLVRDGARRRKRHRRLKRKIPDRPAYEPERPDTSLERAERIAAVRAALDRIRPRDRRMLLMREEGFTYKEIAEAVDVAPGSVGTLLARALRRFRDAYATVGEEHGPRE